MLHQVDFALELVRVVKHLEGKAGVGFEEAVRLGQFAPCRFNVIDGAAFGAHLAHGDAVQRLRPALVDLVLNADHAVHQTVPLVRAIDE